MSCEYVAKLETEIERLKEREADLISRSIGFICVDSWKEYFEGKYDHVDEANLLCAIEKVIGWADVGYAAYFEEVKEYLDDQGELEEEDDKEDE